MENNVFTDPAVAGTLSEHFVESRLHLETFSERGGEDWTAFVELRDRYAESIAMPTYAIVNPETGERLGWHQLQGAPPWVGEIKGFLETALGE